MKNILLFVFAVLLIYSCDTTETPPPDYTYSISSVWWSDSLDANNDGYFSFKRLNFNVHLAEDVARTVYARIYYKRFDASSFTFYAFSDDKRVIGKNGDNFFGVGIGTPNKELSRGVYDFKIEVYEKDSERIEAVPDSAQNIILFGNKFEESFEDKDFSMTVWWSDSLDKDEDGYWRAATLNINADVNDSGTREMNAKVFYKKEQAAEYTLYDEIDNFTISGNGSSDAVALTVGDPNEELEYGLYDFRVELYETGSGLLVDFVDQALPALNDVGFETEDDDLFFYSIDKVWWSDSLDLDGDGFTQFRRINFDVNIDKDYQRTIYAKIYTRPPDSSNYEMYDSTANFVINGSNAEDFYSVPVGLINEPLDSTEYDFLISVFEAGVDTFVEASRSAFIDSVMALQKFETAQQDSL
jgi:hypothetical protein